MQVFLFSSFAKIKRTSTEMVPIGTSVESLAHEEMIPEGLVRMVTPLGPAHTLDGLHCTTGSILRMMDIATCASAEKHSGVNCVTVAVGDVVLEYVPMAGEVLEIVAEPVLVGNTSIEIAVLLVTMAGKEAAMPGYLSNTYLLICGLSEDAV